MTLILLYKLLAIFCTVAIGWVAGRAGWLGQPAAGWDPARVLSNVAFHIFVPALLFRTTARLDMAHLPWATVLAFFVPAVGVLLLVYAVRRWQGPAAHGRPGQGAEGGTTRPAADSTAPRASAEAEAAAPASAAVTVVFGNSVQVGIPVAAAMFGEAGLGLHIALVSLHALVLLSLGTVLAELDVARARAAHDGHANLWRTLRQTVRNTVVHPVVLPVLAGLAWHATGWPLPGPLDETLQLLGTAVSPLCLVLIGVTLAYTPLAGALRPAMVLALLKLLALPAAVLGLAHGLFGLAGLPLQVVVALAAAPAGSNALIFAQRYRTLEAETTTAILLSTLAYGLTLPVWLALAARMA